ncbi:MAG: nucleotidyltransferase family protein [Trebonia sp.]
MPGLTLGGRRRGDHSRPYDSTEAAIDSFAATACCLEVRLETDNQWRAYAPHGLSDLFGNSPRPPSSG